jgi:hypothetical protein
VSRRKGIDVVIPRLGFAWVSRADVARTRPALERARYRCECCPRDDGLRVVEGFDQLVVLCPECAIGGGFKMVLAHRKVGMLQSTGGDRW